MYRAIVSSSIPLARGKGGQKLVLQEFTSRHGPLRQGIISRSMIRIKPTSAPTVNLHKRCDGSLMVFDSRLSQAVYAFERCSSDDQSFLAESRSTF
jgi:hypothetical protein